ncbi:MAG: hypothetical protein CM15mP120_07040 [Pseudomonadota bacterium]|nr:MAG: hypothetical protein CM15mP120_07040 [Pseudomonadota bacterium]
MKPAARQQQQWESRARQTDRENQTATTSVEAMINDLSL